MHFLPDFGLDYASFLFYTLAFTVFVQLMYHLFFHARLAFGKQKTVQTTEKPPVSVIIAARNEANNLQEFLPLILNQNYPNFEVVVVNNQSTDESYFILNEFKKVYPNLKVVEVERTRHLGTGKKIPLNLGIKAAKHALFVMTDADCEPSSNNWLSLIMSSFSDKKEIVLGFGPYREQKGFINKVIRFDTISIAVNYLSFALGKMPYMGVGRNLAYSKKVFDSVQGFKSHYAIQSGDDDLFVQESAKKKNYTIQIDPDSFCYSKAKSNFEDWVLQKSRHYSTATRYGFIKKIFLGAYPLAVFLSWATFFALLPFPKFILLAATVFGSILLIKWLILGFCYAKLGGKSFIALLPILDLFYAIGIPILYFSTEKSNATRWK